MEIDQKIPLNSIIELSKAFDNVHASKSDPARQTVTVPLYLYSTYNKQMKESQELTRNSATEIDQNDQNPTNAQHHSNDEWPRSDKFY